MKVSKKVIIVAGLVICIIVVASVIVRVVTKSKSSTSKPKGNSASNFLLNDVFYDCSKSIKGEWRRANIGVKQDPGYYFHPSNQEEFKKYCREGAVIEYRAVIDILKRDDVDKLIAKYDTTKTWVRALGHRYIHDKGYLKRILPTYSDTKIDCIIVVHSPEGTRFFIEDGEKHQSHDDHHYLEVSDKEFLASLNKASDADINAFWLGLH